MKLLLLGSGSYKSILSIRLLALARHLAPDWQVSLILPSADKYNAFTPTKDAQVQNLTLIQPWQFTTHSAILNLLPYLFTSFSAMLRVHAKVIYLYKPTPVTILGLIPRLLFRTPVILDLDDLGSEVIKAQGRSRLEYILVKTSEQLALRYASAVVVASTYLETLVKTQYPGKPTLLLPNGVEPSDYQAVRQGVPRQAVYYFGAIDRLSLIEGLLRALPDVMQVIPHVKVTIVGGGTALSEAKQLAEDLGITEAVEFTDWVDILAAQRYTRFADIAVCYQPDTKTVQAASNMKVFQYMAMRTVPLVSDVGDLATYVEHGQAGAVVPADNVTALSTELISLLQNTSRRIQIANRGVELAQTDYSWKQRAAKLDGFIRNVLEGTRRTR